MAPFLVVLISNLSRIYILFIQWLGADVGDTDKWEQWVLSLFVFWNVSPVPLFCWVPQRSNDIQVVFSRLPDQLASSWTHFMGGIGWWWEGERKREALLFSFTFTVLGGFSSSSCLSSWTLDSTRQLCCDSNSCLMAPALEFWSLRLLLCPCILPLLSLITSLSPVWLLNSFTTWVTNPLHWNLSVLDTQVWFSLFLFEHWLIQKDLSLDICL